MAPKRAETLVRKETSIPAKSHNSKFAPQEDFIDNGLPNPMEAG